MGNRRLHFGETIAFAKRAPRRSDSPRPRQPTKSAPPERVQLSRLADLGFHWDRHARRATVEPHSRKKVDTVTLSEAVSVLRILDCKELDLTHCDSLKNVDSLKELRALTILNLSICSNLQNVDGLKGLTALTHLELLGCRSLQNFDGLKGLTALTSLNLVLCDSLQNVDGLKELTALAHLELSRCSNLQNVDGLKEARALTSLYLRGCPKISAGDIQALKVALTKAKIESSNY